jgi:hypothetical protein
MNNSKLIKVLKTLKKSEFKQFGKLVHSPFFSKGRNVIPLFDILKKFYPNFDSEEFNRDNILEELSRNGYKATYQQLKTQMSEMYKLVEQFLIIQEGMSETGLSAYFFAKNCDKRGLYEIGESKILSSIKIIEKNGIDQRYYRNYFYGKSEMIVSYSIRNKLLKVIPVYDHLSEILLHQFLCYISRYVFAIVVLRRGFNTGNTDNLLFNFLNNTNIEKLLKELGRRKDIYSNASRAYLLLILIFLKFRNSGKDYYFRLKKELFKNILIFSSFDKYFFSHAIYIWAEDMIRGANYIEFAKEVFGIINFRLKNNLYKGPPGTLTPFTLDTFCSFFYIGFILKEKHWLKNFRKKYLSEVMPEQKKNSAVWTNIFIDFLEGNYIKCLDGINHLINVVLPFMFPVKRLQLMTLYELGHITEAFYAIDAFKSFLRQNKKISEEFMESNTNFIKLYSKLLKHKHGEKELNLKKTMAEVKNSAADNQEWIIEKINELAVK